MLKSGLIVGAIMLFHAMGATLVSPVCVPCVGLLLGLGAGYLAGGFEKPTAQKSASKTGALAGVIGGGGTFLGQMVGAIINAIFVGPEKAAQIVHDWGLLSTPASSPALYWIGFFGSNLCVVIISVLLMAGMGALGGLLWWQTTGKNKLSQPTANPFLPL
jgi:hypothetical protein